jgi:hypothetical protein
MGLEKREVLTIALGPKKIWVKNILNYETNDSVTVYVMSVKAVEFHSEILLLLGSVGCGRKHHVLKQ